MGGVLSTSTCCTTGNVIDKLSSNDLAGCGRVASQGKNGGTVERRETGE